MLRYHKPSRIELKKSDLDDLERKKADDEKKRLEATEKLPLVDITQNDSSLGVLPNISAAAPPTMRSRAIRQNERRRRLGFTPESVANDGTTGIRF